MRIPIASQRGVQRLCAWLEQPRWSRRLGAMRVLARWPGRLPAVVRQKLLTALEDRRGLESYPACLAAAALLLNHNEHCNEAIALCLEALEYGSAPWEYLPDSGEIRQQAALALGKLEPLRYDARVYDRLLAVMHNDKNATVRDAAYGALLRLARAKEEQAQAAQ